MERETETNKHTVHTHAKTGTEANRGADRETEKDGRVNGIFTL